MTVTRKANKSRNSAINDSKMQPKSEAATAFYKSPKVIVIGLVFIAVIVSAFLLLKQGNDQERTSATIESIIEHNLDVICSGPLYSSASEDYIMAHQTEFDEIVELGEEGLAYMLTLLEQRDNIGLREVIMQQACNEILDR